MYKFIKGAYRQREIWLGSNGRRSHMSRLPKNGVFYGGGEDDHGCDNRMGLSQNRTGYHMRWMESSN